MATVLEEYISSLQTVNKRFKELKLELDQLDKDKLDLYHIMECVPLNAYKFSRISYLLRDTLRKRREVKEELYQLQSIVDTHKLDKITINAVNSINRVERITKESMESYKRFDILITFDHE